MTDEHTVATAQRLVAGRYALLSEIGRGGMGIVWLAEDRTIGRRVAVKELQLPAGVPAEERAVLEERVLREARTAGRLNDPAVVTVYDVVQGPDGTFIVMELIEAPTLSAVVGRQGPLPQEAVARLAEQLLSALEAAHAAGIVHRDVKPSNIMVLPNGRVKLADFGIAQSTDDPHLTTSGILVGSPTYIAPERIKGAEAVASSDLWSLGAVLFFAVEGHSPYERSSTAATMHAIVSEVPFLTRGQGPLASVIMGLLNTVPEARPSAEQVRGLLTQATATPPSGLATAMYAQPGHPGTALITAPQRAGGRPRTTLVLVAAVVLAAGLFAGGFFTHQALSSDGRPDNMDATITYGDGGYLPELSWDSNYGSCLNGRLAEGQRITSSAQVEDCDEPHDLEIYHWETELAKPSDTDYEPRPDAKYPDQAELSAYAEHVCTMIFQSNWVTGSKDEFRYRAIVPTDKSWPDDGRQINCVLYRADGGQLAKSYVA